MLHLEIDEDALYKWELANLYDPVTGERLAVQITPRGVLDLIVKCVKIKV